MHYQYPVEAAPVFTDRFKDGHCFGFAEADIEIPKRFWLRFEEIAPFFFKQIPDEALPQHMKGLLRAQRQNNRCGNRALSPQTLLLYAPLLHWYVEQGAVIAAVHYTIDYMATSFVT